MSERLALTISDGIAEVRLTRAAKMNALDVAMFEQLAAAIARLLDEPGLRAVVLSAEGKGFCAGLDRAMMHEIGSYDLVPRTHGIANLFQKVVWGWREIPVPVVAAVQGAAFGGGCQLALGPDIRYVAPDAQLSIMEIKWGLVPDMAGTPILPRLVRDDALREIAYTGKVLTARQAVELGLATRVCDDPRAAAFDTAREIAGKNPDAVRALKRMINQLGPDPAPLLLAESVAQMKIQGTPNQREAVRANLENRAPGFLDPPGYS